MNFEKVEYEMWIHHFVPWELNSRKWIEVVFEKTEFQSLQSYSIKINVLNKQMLPKYEHVSSATLENSIFTTADALLMYSNYFNKTYHHF